MLALIAYVTASFGVVAGVYFLFKKAERVVNDETRQRTAKRLRELQLGSGLGSWAEEFGTLFDSVFGEKHFRPRCFLRSCVASFAAVAVMTAVWWFVQPEGLEVFLNEMSDVSGSVIDGFVVIALFACMFNIIPDYLSLLESRYAIRVISRHPSPVRVVLLLTFDTLVTTAIFLGPFFAIGAVGLWFDEKAFPWRNISVYLWEAVSFRAEPKDRSWVAVFFWSTFFTSAWIWLYVASLMVVRFSKALGGSWVWLHSRLNFDKKPYETLGFIASVISAVVMIALGIVITVTR